MPFMSTKERNKLKKVNEKLKAERARMIGKSIYYFVNIVMYEWTILKHIEDDEYEMEVANRNRRSDRTPFKTIKDIKDVTFNK